MSCARTCVALAPLPVHCGRSRHHLRATRGARCAATPETADIFVAKRDALRAAPLWIGGLGGLGLLGNRALSGVAAVADASSSQSRTDVICLALAACLLLTGLQWASLKSKAPRKVVLRGEVVRFKHPDLDDALGAELQWCWESLENATGAGALIVVFDDKRLFQAGLAPAAMAFLPEAPPLGDICRRAMADQRGNYMANMTLFPGRVEFEPFLPINSQGVIVQPIGKRGVIIAATDTVRGFSQLDQAWLSVMSDKLENTLETSFPPSP